MARPINTIEQSTAHFWSRVNKDGPTPSICPDLGPCWLWMGSGLMSGYGELKVRGKKYLAHRFSWWLATGSEPGKWHVLHRCDTPPCVNPAHLFLGDQYANNADRNAKGHTPKGEKNGMSRLTPEQVLAIRALCASGWSQSRAAAFFKISQVAVCNIINKKRWAHL